MKDEAINTNIHSISTPTIEKYSGSFSQDDLGVTQIPTETIKAISDLADLAVFTFLASQSKNWRLNAKHLADHFGCDKKRIYKSIDSLINKGFLTKTIIREKGKFASFHYTLHLRQKTESEVKPFPEKRNTYKTYNIKNIENTKNIIGDSEESADCEPTKNEKSADFEKKKAKSLCEYKDDIDFMEWYRHYPNKQKPHQAYKSWKKLNPDDELKKSLISDVKLRIENNWNGRAKNHIAYPSTYLNTREWEGEIVKNSSKSHKKTLSWDDIKKRAGICDAEETVGGILECLI